MNASPASVDPATRIGWIGLGVMGAPMCGHVLSKGYHTTVFSRTQAKAQPLLDRGAIWAASSRAVAEVSDVVFTMVGFPPDVRQVYLAENGILAAARPGIILVDMTTSMPSLAREIHAAARQRQACAIDAPVSGGDVGARNATLSIMVGGDEAAVAAVRPLLELLGRQIVHQGPAGAGQNAKMCNQIVIASTMIGVCEALLYGRRAGLDLQSMLASIRGGAAGCWTLENLAPRILTDNFAPGFLVEHFIKDMGIALEEARRMNLELPGLSLAHHLYRALAAQGHARSGTHALYHAIEKLSSENDPPGPGDA